MRFLLCAAVVAALSLSASAQTGTDSSGVYVGLGLGYSTSSGLIGPALAVGYRQANGLEYGVGGRLDQRPSSPLSSYSAYSVGANVGYARPIGAGFTLRGDAVGTYASLSLSNSAPNADPSAFDGSAAILDLSAELSRPLLSVGSVRVEPAIGGYVTLQRGFGQDGSNAYSDLDLTGVDAGLQLGVDLSFRLLGADVTVPIFARVPLTDDPVLRDQFGSRWLPQATVRINF